MNAAASEFRVLIPAEIHLDSGRPVGDLLASSGRCMGTGWSVRFICADPMLAAQVNTQIPVILECIEAQMSHFREDSVLNRFGRLSAGELIALPPEFARVMQSALLVAWLSEGAFDPTLAASVEDWGFGAGQCFSDANFVPPDEVRKPQAAWRRLVIDEGAWLRQPGGVRLNLAAVAKGFAVDAVSEYLTWLGLGNHLVEVGGELRGAGTKPDGQPWWVALEQPDAACSLPVTRIALHGLAVATSGHYRRRYQHQGRSLQHTIDPRTGEPVMHELASVSVIHEECMLADAWATALMVSGPQAGLAMAEARGLCALLQWQDEGGVWCEASSFAFQQMQ